MSRARLITVTLSSAVDRVIEAAGFAAGKHVPAREVARLAAGKGFNVSRGLAALGEPCFAAGLVGKREFEWFGGQLCDAAGARVRPMLVLAEEPTRECFTIRDPESRGEWHLRGESPVMNAADAERLVSQVLRVVDKRSMVALCGSAPPGAGLACFLALLGECRARGARVAVDTSGAALAAIKEDAMWLLKINSDELAAMTGKATGTLRQVIAAARPLCQVGNRGRRHVIVTRGRNGAVWVSPTRAVRSCVAVAPNRISGTVGCGDALLAGLLAAQVRGSSWPVSLRLGVASATALALSDRPGMFARNAAMVHFKRATAESC